MNDRMPFLPVAFISMVMGLARLSIALHASVPTLSWWLWAMGSGLHLAFTLYMLNA